MIFIVYGLSLLNPLFFQELLGYSPWKSGIVVLPRGFGSVVGMLLVGQLSRHAFDTRWLVGLGFVVLAYALWAMSSWTLDVSIESVRCVMILSGLGTALIFPVMSKATLACVEKPRMGYAASLYGMMRNTGGGAESRWSATCSTAESRRIRPTSPNILRSFPPGGSIRWRHTFQARRIST